jgi:flagellar biosynthesis/type III secretory pathway protein FliH
MRKSYAMVFDGDMVKAVIPNELARAIMKVMAEENLDLPSACKVFVERANSGSEKFKRDVMDQARKLHNSELMKQINSARATIRAQSYNDGHQAGYKKGYDSAKAKYEIWYFCDVCNGRLTVSPNDGDHNAVIESLKEKGWGHASCHNM